MGAFYLCLGIQTDFSLGFSIKRSGYMQVFHQLFCDKVFCISDLDVVARVDFFFFFSVLFCLTPYTYYIEINMHMMQLSADTVLCPVPQSKAKVCKLATAVCCLFSEQIGPQDRPSGTLSFCC